MGLIEDFVSRYRREYDYYDQVSRLVAQILDSNLQGGGFRAIVTSRAKSPTRLDTKLRQRDATKHYVSAEDIYADIVDLAGVRVALYFPAEREEVGKLVRTLFVLTDSPKHFPTTAAPSYEKRFSGYWATHYRVQLKEATLNDAQKRYAEARVEVQVASVLMHAWSEVEHDLVYKPLEGRLSEDEYAILDELNGLVMSGEIALERLQRAVEARVMKRGSPFTNHYDLAAYLFDATRGRVVGPAGDATMGRVDILFALLHRLGIATPEAVEPYISGLDPDIERRPIAEQIVDQVLSADANRYKIYEEVRASDDSKIGFMADAESARTDEVHEAIGFFLTEWITFERALRDLRNRAPGPDGTHPVPSTRAVGKMGLFGQEQLVEFDRIRRMRNNLVHGVETPDSATIREAAQALRRLLDQLPPPPPQPPQPN